MKIADVMSALKTYLEGLSWTSDDGEGTTSFQAVYTFPNWSNDTGYPFVVIQDTSAEGRSIDNKFTEIQTTISLSICVNYAIVNKTTDEEKVEEAMLRLREAWDYLKTQLLKDATLSTLGIDWNMNPAYIDNLDDSLNLYQRTITLVVKEIINRG